MAKKQPSDSADPNKTANLLTIERRDGKTDEQLLTELAMSPMVRNTLTAKSYAHPSFAGDPPQLEAAIKALTTMCEEVRDGNLEKLTDMLAAQAITLDTIFTEYSRRSLLNAGQYIAAAESYANMASKAQANCRATVEAIAKIKRGGKQTVKVVHVHEGGQAVVAETINQGGAGGKTIKRPHAKDVDAPLAAVSGPDQARDGVPVPGDAERKVPVTRR